MLSASALHSLSKLSFFCVGTTSSEAWAGSYLLQRPPKFGHPGVGNVQIKGCPQVRWRVKEGNRAQSSALDGENQGNLHSACWAQHVRPHPAVNHPARGRRLWASSNPPAVGSELSVSAGMHRPWGLLLDTENGVLSMARAPQRLNFSLVLHSNLPFSPIASHGSL
jgi:hypothetical protein